MSRLPITRRAAALFVVAVLCACASTRTTRFDAGVRYPERTPEQSIRFYGSQRPSCQFEELGRVTSESRFFASWDRVVSSARKAAHDLGGDAIISVRDGSRLSTEPTLDGGVTVKSTSTLSGIVIRFLDESCMS